MRLIDADALEQEYRRQFESVYKHTRDTVLPSDFYIERKAAYDKELVRMEMEAFCEFLKSRPTIDADAYFDAVDRIKPCPKCRYQIFGSEPVRHGRWIVEDIVIDNNGRTMPDWPRCSECDRQSDLEYDYCPNCGAKMDEEVQHAEKRSDS